MSTRTQLADPRTLRRATVGRKMNKSEATALTAQIRATAHGLWRLVAEAYDRQAWRALGYTSWKDYATEELQMSESRSYQLIDTGRVMRAIGEVVGSESVFETVVVTARETAKVKPHMSTFKRELEAYVKEGVPAEEAVEMAISGLPTTEKRVLGPRAPKVIDGEVVAPEPALPPIIPDAPKPSGRASGVAVPLFSAGEQPPTPMKPPRGKKVCTACEGHGWV